MFELVKKALIVVIVLFFAKIGWQIVVDDYSYQSWPTAPARLISAEVAVGSKKNGSRYFVVQTTYDFTVNGKVYNSGANKIGVPRFATDQAALQHLDELKSRSTHIVHYHPQTPEKNTLSQ
ncbi:MAG: DUF3592 domain-containing protein [Cellvibrio sp.]